MKKALSKILHIVVDVLVVCVLIVSVLILTMTLTSRAGGGVPNVFGKAPINVLTNSMHGDNEDSFDQGDLIICDALESGVGEKFEVGDVVTFVGDINGDGEQDFITHRIYKVKKDGTFLTKGDNNETYDQDEHNAVVFPAIHDFDILAVYHGTKIGGLGGFIGYIQTPMGFFLIILLPMIIFFIYQAVRVVINIIGYNKEKALAQAEEKIKSSDLTEEQKKRAIEEYLAQQSANAPPETPEAPEIPETPEADSAPTPSEE